jgi:hypothetical protein
VFLIPFGIARVEAEGIAAEPQGDVVVEGIPPRDEAGRFPVASAGEEAVGSRIRRSVSLDDLRGPHFAHDEFECRGEILAEEVPAVVVPSEDSPGFVGEEPAAAIVVPWAEGAVVALDQADRKESLPEVVGEPCVLHRIDPCIQRVWGHHRTSRYRLPFQYAFDFTNGSRSGRPAHTEDRIM